MPLITACKCLNCAVVLLGKYFILCLIITELNESFGKQLRMIHRFHEQVFQRMPPERRARKLAVMKALAKSAKNKNKENEDPLNNNMALPCKFTHSTPVKNLQVTDLDDVESDTVIVLREFELCDIEERDEETRWGEQEEPKLIISKVYDLTDSHDGDTDNGPECLRSESEVAGVTVLEVSELDNKVDKHWSSLEALHETAEYEFCRSLEESKLFVSTSSLLEEIEADLPSSYSLAKPLNHTFHTLTSYRTQARLARMVRPERSRSDATFQLTKYKVRLRLQRRRIDRFGLTENDGNLTCSEILKQKESLKVRIPSKKIDVLEIEETVQKALAEQAEKALILSKSKKFFGVQHIESEKALLLANLRCNAVMQEIKKLKMCGEVPDTQNFGQVTISDICFEVNESKNDCPEKYICTITEREHVQSTSIVSKVTDGKLHFSDSLKFSNLSKDFVIYIDLFKLLYKEPKRALLNINLLKKLKRMTTVNLNRSLTSPSYSKGGFTCVAQCELRLENIVAREDNKCVLQNYLTVNLQRQIVGSVVNLLVKTDINLKSKKSGFLNVFKKTWHRKWFLQYGYFIESWLYPEDQECDKAPVDSIYLPNCESVEPVGLEVCARPHSFLIKLKESNEEVLFSANSHKDMLTWVDHLNVTLDLIRLWKPKI